MLSKSDIIYILEKNGYRVQAKLGGVEVTAEKRTPMFEFDYWEFIRQFPTDQIDTKKIHMLDGWTFTIECE